MSTEKIYILEKGEFFSKKDAPCVLDILKETYAYKTEGELAMDLDVSGSSMSGIRKGKGRLTWFSVKRLLEKHSAVAEKVLGGIIEYSAECRNMSRLETIPLRNRIPFMLELNSLGINFFLFPEKEKGLFKDTGMIPASLLRRIEAKKNDPAYKNFKKQYDIDKLQLFY